jgi:hypothetical protein
MGIRWGKSVVASALCHGMFRFVTVNGVCEAIGRTAHHTMLRRQMLVLKKRKTRSSRALPISTKVSEIGTDFLRGGTCHRLAMADYEATQRAAEPESSSGVTAP